MTDPTLDRTPMNLLAEQRAAEYATEADALTALANIVSLMPHQRPEDRPFPARLARAIIAQYDAEPLTDEADDMLAEAVAMPVTMRAAYPGVEGNERHGFRVVASYHPGFDYPWERVYHFALFGCRHDAEALLRRITATAYGPRSTFVLNKDHWRQPPQVGCTGEGTGATLEETPRKPVAH